MRIAIDVTTLLDQYANRGIGDYTRHLLKELLKNDTHEWHLIGFSDKSTNLKRIGDNFIDKKNIFFYSIGKTTPSSISNLKTSKSFFLPRLNQIQPDIFLSPSFERGVFKGEWKNVVMIHDVIPIASNSFSQKSPLHNYLKGKFYKNQINTVLKNSDYLLTNSEYSKSQIIKFLNVNKKDISAIKLGIDKSNIYHKDKYNSIQERSILERYGIKEAYCLYFGGLEENKNIHTLIKAYSNAKPKIGNTKLVIISGDFQRSLSGKIIPKTSQAKTLYELAKKENLLNDIVFTGFVEEEHMPLVTYYSSLFVHLSNEEGFGLSVLEAISNGVPSIISDIPVYRELFSTKVLFVAQKNINQISDAIVNLINDEKLADSLRSKSEEISRIYSWEKTATATLAIFEKLNTNTEIINNSTEVNSSPDTQPEIDSEKPKVAFAIPHFFPFKGGAENYAFEIAKRLAKDGNKAEVYTSKHEPDLVSKENYLGIEINRSKPIIDKYYLKFYPGLFMQLMKSDADIIHAQGFGFIWQDFCLILKRFFSRKKIRFINTPHGPFMAQKNYSSLGNFAKKLFTAIQKLYLNWLYDVILTVNPNQSRWIHRDYGINLDKIKFLPIGIDKNHFYEPKNEDLTYIRKELKINESDTVMTYLGRFHRYKGVHDLLEACSNLEINNYKLVMMGSDSGELGDMRKFVIENNLEDQVIILEKPSDQKRDLILDISEVFIFPSEWEAYGIAMLEAMAHKNALISSKTEGGLHLIKNKENGILFTYGNINELNLSIIKLLSDKPTRERMISFNYTKAKSLQWDNIWDEYRGIYS